MQKSKEVMFCPKVHWAGRGEEFSDDRLISIESPCYGERRLIQFELPKEAREIARLRFDPSENEGFFHIFRIAVEGHIQGNGDQEEILWELNSAKEIAHAADLKNAVFGSSLLGEVFESRGRKPQLVFRFKDAIQSKVEQRLIVKVEMDWPKSRDFIVARDCFMEREQLLVARNIEQAAEIERLRGLESELDTMKRSRVWRVAEKYRKLVYIKILGRIPFLQKLVLSVSRRGIRGTMSVIKGYLGQRGLEGIFSTAQRDGKEKVPIQEIEYRKYLQLHRLTENKKCEKRQRIKAFKRKPKISIITPVFNVDPRWLEAAIKSVDAQVYENWELCITDDCSTKEETVRYLKELNHPKVKLALLKKHKNISGATNDAIARSSGEYVAFLDNDDELAADALFEVVKAINESDPDVMYSDEDFIDLTGNRVKPHFKPDYSPDLLLSHNYITHLLVIKRGLLERVGLLRSEYDGAQDYDLVLRVCEATNKIHHLSKILYHWRMSEQSTSLSPEAKPAALRNARKVLEDALVRRNISASVINANIPFFFRVKRKILGKTSPLVSIIVPFKDKPELLKLCLDTLVERTTYKNFEVVGISNNSDLADTFVLMRAYEKADERIRFFEHNVPFNFSKLVNYGAKQANGEHLVLMNNDIEVISWDWIETLIEHSQRAEVGVVGGKLLYPDNRIQHAGIIVGIGGYAGHAHKHFAVRQTGYFNRLNLIQNVSAVTGAFLMVKKNIFREVGGFDEERLKVACNDVDFCLRVMKKGYLNIYTPYAEAYHRESSSRGYEDTVEKKARFVREKAYFLERHKEILANGDPFYNRNLSLDSEKYQIRL